MELFYVLYLHDKPFAYQRQYKSKLFQMRTKCELNACNQAVTQSRCNCSIDWFSPNRLTSINWFLVYECVCMSIIHKTLKMPIDWNTSIKLHFPSTNFCQTSKDVFIECLIVFVFRFNCDFAHETHAHGSLKCIRLKCEIRSTRGQNVDCLSMSANITNISQIKERQELVLPHCFDYHFKHVNNLQRVWRQF